MNEHDLIIFSQLLFSKEFCFEYKEKKQFYVKLFNYKENYMMKKKSTIRQLL